MNSLNLQGDAKNLQALTVWLGFMCDYQLLSQTGLKERKKPCSDIHKSNDNEIRKQLSQLLIVFLSLFAKQNFSKDTLYVTIYYIPIWHIPMCIYSICVYWIYIRYVYGQYTYICAHMCLCLCVYCVYMYIHVYVYEYYVHM